MSTHDESLRLLRLLMQAVLNAGHYDTCDKLVAGDHYECSCPWWLANQLKAVVDDLESTR